MTPRLLAVLVVSVLVPASASPALAGSPQGAADQPEGARLQLPAGDRVYRLATGSQGRAVALFGPAAGSLRPDGSLDD